MNLVETPTKLNVYSNVVIVLWWFLDVNGAPKSQIYFATMMRTFENYVSSELRKFYRLSDWVRFQMLHLDSFVEICEFFRHYEEISLFLDFLRLVTNRFYWNWFCNCSSRTLKHMLQESMIRPQRAKVCSRKKNSNQLVGTIVFLPWLAFSTDRKRQK